MTERRRAEDELRSLKEDLDRQVQARTAELETANRMLGDLLHNEQQLRAAAQAADRAKDDFLATLSHELRTPITALIGWTHVLMYTRVDEETRRHALEVMERSARSQARLIDEILDVSRIVSGKLLIETSLVDLTSIVRTAVGSARPLAEPKTITLTCTSAEPIHVLGDDERLQQVLWNLLSNAIKFTPQGGRIAVAAEVDGTQAKVSVADSGQGIAPELLPHVFERFRQGETGATRSHGGLGIGLTIARYIVEQHGGSIEARSEGAGRGSIFSFYLPGASRAVAPDPRPIENTAAGAPLRVLIVEDDTDTRDMLVAALGHLDFDAAGAATASEAIDAVAKWRPDVLVSDISLPAEDGLSLLRRVRRLRSEDGGSVPAIALSGWAGAESRESVLAAGFQELIAKPIEPPALARLVRSVALRQRGRDTAGV